MDIASSMMVAEYAESKFGVGKAKAARRHAPETGSPFDSTARCAAARAPGSHPPPCAAPVPLFDAATLAHRWPAPKPQPRAFLRKGGGGHAPPAPPPPLPSPRRPAPPPESPRPPAAGGWSPRDNPPNTLFRLLYERGDVPACVAHGAGGVALRWRCDLRADTRDAWLPWLPLFLDGCRETADPYRFLAVRGAEELLAAAGPHALPLLPQLVPPLRRALVTRDKAVVATAALLLQALLRSCPAAGPALVPFYKQLLPTLRLFAATAPRAQDGHDYGQRFRGARNLAAIVDQTLHALHRAGGPAALKHIRAVVPTFQTCDA